MDKQLTKYDRYRLKDVEGYRKRKREWARTPDQKRKRREYMRLWRDKNRDRHNELARQSYSKHRDKRSRYMVEYNLRKNYGLTSEQYVQMLDDQKGVCAICANPPPEGKKLHVDHNHTTGEVRRLLCSRCNGALGWFEKYENDINNYLNKYGRQ